VKIKKLHISIPLLLLTLFNVLSSSAFSIPSETLDHNSRHSYILKLEQNTKAIFTEEASVIVVIESASNPDVLASGTFKPNTFTSLEVIPSFSTCELLLYSPDLKELISQNIFPFQFFW